MRSFLYLLIIAAFYTSCGVQKSALTAEQYLSWFKSEENPLRFRDTSHNGVLTLVELRPVEYDAANCVRTNCAPSDSVKKYLQEERKTLDFVLKYKLPSQNMFDFNPKGEIRSYDRMEYYGFKFKEDIKLITLQNDTIDCTDLFFERTAPDAPIGNFEFSFPNIDFENINCILINNRALFDETSVFKLSKAKQYLPKLKV